MLSPLLAGTSLPLERVTAQKFRAGQIISDRPSGVLSVGLIVSGRVEVYSVALDGVFSIEHDSDQIVIAK